MLSRTVPGLLSLALLWHVSRTNQPTAALSDQDWQTSRTAVIQRLGQLNKNIETRGLRPFPGSKDKLLTGYAYGEFFDWDLYFENLYLSYYGVSRYDFTNLRVFLDRQQPDGFISRTLGITYPKPKQMFKPFLAQLVVLGAKQNQGSYHWLENGDYQKLQKYVDRWFEYDGDRNGLPVWNSADASGMDNQIRRSGGEDSYFDEGVDLACYLVRELRAMSEIAKHLSRSDDAAMYTQRADALSKRINATLWDEHDGFYYDRNEKTGQLIRLKSVVGFLPLWAGVAPKARAQRLVKEHLLNPREFWTEFPIPTYALSEPDFYEGSRHGECNWQGNTWVPTNYMVFHGLLEYGFDDAAEQLADKTSAMALKNPVTREYYDSITGAGYGMNPFWGWSSLAYAMPLEFRYRYNPMSLSEPNKRLLRDALGVMFPQP